MASIALVVALVVAGVGCRNAAEEEADRKLGVLQLSNTEVGPIIRDGDKLVVETDLAIGKFTLVEKEIVTGTDGGGALKTYFDGTKVKKILLKVGLSSRLESTEFYFDDLEKLIVIVRKARPYKWNDSNGALVPDISDIEEVATKVYLKNDAIAAEVSAASGTKGETDENYVVLAERLIGLSRSDESRLDAEALFK